VSVDLGNASHFDVGDSSQGFSVWTEEIPGKSANWFFVMPNLYCTNNGTPFNGVAVRLYHGTAISWDGRVIRHCTSLTRPDGAKKPIGGGRDPTVNHVYGTFSAAKKRAVNAGRRGAAAAAAAGCTVEASLGDAFAPVGVDVVGAAKVCDDNDDDDNEEEKFPQEDEVLPPYDPKIEDADPDRHPPPRDGSQIAWLQFYAQKKDWDRAQQPDEVAAEDDDSSLFSRNSCDGDDHELADTTGMDTNDGDGHVGAEEDFEADTTTADSITAAMLMQGNYAVPRKKRQRY
jgi:hypothetical protein